MGEQRGGEREGWENRELVRECGKNQGPNPASYFQNEPFQKVCFADFKALISKCEWVSWCDPERGEGGWKQVDLQQL